MIKNRFREYFTYTRKERNGLIVLLFILFVLILVKVYQSNKSYGEIVLIDNDFKKEIEEFERNLIQKQNIEKNNQKLDGLNLRYYSTLILIKCRKVN